MTTRRLPEKILKSTPDKDGYLQVGLGVPGASQFKTRKVHHLVLEAFVGPRPAGTEACHFPDSCCASNAVTNLMWGTPKQNNSQKKAHGTYKCGEQMLWAKLKEEDIQTIFDLRHSGELAKDIAVKFGVCRDNIYAILRRKSWRHVQIQ